MWIELLSGISCNFIPPTGLTAKKEVLFPVSDAQAIAYASAITIPVAQMHTVVTVAVLTGALTLNVSVDAQVTPGARLIVKLLSDTTARDTTLGTGFEGTTIAGVISKTKVAVFEYDGTNFVHVSTSQID